MRHDDLPIIALGSALEQVTLANWTLARSYRLVGCGSWRELHVVVRSCSPGLIAIFDLKPLSLRLEGIAALRACHQHVPIVCAAEPGEAEALLAHGATDFFGRPYAMDDVFARLTARIEQFRASNSGEADEPAPDTVGRRSGQVRWEGKAIVLHPSARRILVYLCDHAGRAVSVEELQAEVLCTRGRSHTVHNHIYEIRKALKAVGIANPISTHRGSGCFSVSTQLAHRFPSVKEDASRLIRSP